MSFDDEISAAFSDIDEAVGEPFTYAGGTYVGIFATNDLKTAMLTGNYNTVSSLVLRASKPQFAETPPQRAGVLVRLKDASTWGVAEIDPSDSTHYVFTIRRQVVTK